MGVGAEHKKITEAKMSLTTAIGNSISFPGSKPPEESVELGRVEQSGGIFIYFKGVTSGTYYYGTERGIEFARRMEEKQKKRKAPIH